jgi:excisionase family DNA binding protein
MDESIYDLAGAAQYLGMTARKLKDLCRDKRIAHSRLDYRSYRFRRSDVEGYLETYKFRRSDVTPSFQPSASRSLSRQVNSSSPNRVEERRPRHTIGKRKREVQHARREGLMKAEEAAAYVGVHVDTLRKWVRLGKFPRIPLPGKGKDFRFTKELIDEWASRRALGVD